MSTILLFQRHRMLQQAVAVSLFPEHEIRVADAVSETSDLADVDAVIIDAASADDRATAQAVKAAQKWTVPIVWIEGVGASQAPPRDNLVVVKTPLQREALHAALAQVLGLSSKSPGPKRPQDKQPEGSPTALAAQEPQRAANTKVIDLLDVVEDPSSITAGKGRQAKP